jgi:MerR family transcriptional regulator, redox-sensitive transcriptional activator SoxR
MKKPTDLLPIGELARRTGLSTSAIRFYESKGLVSARRNAAGQRRFPRSDIRRLSFVLIAQQLGMSIDEIGTVLSRLPDARTPTQRDWAAISRSIRKDLDARIATLERLRDRLDGCIGCGCLSLDNCALYNPEDRLNARGPGPRILLGDAPSSPTGAGTHR